MHAKPDLRVFLKWTINRSGSVITDVICMKSLLPAIPTVLIAALLSVDFDGTLYRLYLLALVVVPGFSILALLLYFACAVYSKNLLSTSATVFLILFLASLVFHAIGTPADSLVQNFTPYNRVSAVIKDTYKNNDQFEFTIVALGDGAQDDFTLDSGYSNVSVNGDYYSGPSLGFVLNPTLLIECDGKQIPATEQNIIKTFASAEMADIALPEYASKFQTHLTELSSTNNLLNSNQPHIEIGFQADPNTVYRVMFACTSVFALLLSTILTAKQRSK